jgi:hypothetical protein
MLERSAALAPTATHTTARAAARRRFSNTAFTASTTATTNFRTFFTPLALLTAVASPGTFNGVGGGVVDAGESEQFGAADFSQVGTGGCWAADSTTTSILEVHAAARLDDCMATCWTRAQCTAVEFDPTTQQGM